MAKVLPIVGIVSAAFAMLATLVLVDAGVFYVIPIALAGSVILLAQRNLAGAISGLVILGLAVLAGLGLVGSIATKNGSIDFGISADAGRVWAILACLAVPMGAVIVRWDEVTPRWMAYVGIAGAALSIILAVALRSTLTDQSNVGVLAAGLFALATMFPMGALIRNARPDSATP